MKTKFLSIASALLVLLFVSTSSFAANNSKKVVTNLAEITTFSKIEVHGNVELYVSTGSANNVKVYDTYYDKNALVQEQNGVLRISSYRTEKLVVWVTANDLRAISAYDDAVVKSFGKLSSIDLDLKLDNNATAQLDLDVNDANVVANGNAKASLSGYADQSYVEVSPKAEVNNAKLTASVNIRKQIQIAAAPKPQYDEFAGLY